jgi:hypothetical protein
LFNIIASPKIPDDLKLDEQHHSGNSNEALPTHDKNFPINI